MKEITFDFKVSDRYAYFVTEDGHVYKRDNRNLTIKECFYHIAHGYKRIRVTDIDTCVRRYLRVHRLVATYYVANPNPNNFTIVNHKDGNKQNDIASNLEWCNISMNTQHAYDNNLVRDRGGWIAHPYSERIKLHANTEG